MTISVGKWKFWNFWEFSLDMQDMWFDRYFSEWPTMNFMTRSRATNLISNHLWVVFMIKGGASFRWSFGPLSTWGSIVSTTILTTHPILLSITRYPSPYPRFARVKIRFRCLENLKSRILNPRPSLLSASSVSVVVSVSIQPWYYQCRHKKTYVLVLFEEHHYYSCLGFVIRPILPAIILKIFHQKQP